MYEEALEPILSEIESPMIFEIGAHVGSTTNKLRDISPDSEYYAFEPDPRDLDVLRKFYPDGNIRIVSKAVGQIDGLTMFYLSHGINKAGRLHTDSSSLKTPVAHKDLFPWMTFTETEVECVRLDSFCRGKGIEYIDLIWADVQGAELDMIAGGQETFKRTHWFYTEHMDEPRYEGQPNLGQILKALPGDWRIFIQWKMDALLENMSYREDDK